MVASIAPAVEAVDRKPVESVEIVYLSRADDPYYEPRRLYASLKPVVVKRPFAGVELAVAEARISGRALGVNFVVREIVLEAGENAASRLAESLPKGAAAWVVLDLPKAEMLELVEQATSGDIVFFNPRHGDDDLRRARCGGRLLHTVPSDAMLHDALAQYLQARGWQRVLVLEGPEPADARIARSFERSAARLGLKLVGRVPFVPGNDPRDRDRNRIGLLTAGAAYDIVFVADAIGDFSRYVPYHTQRLALVVGATGLRAAAWHWSWERHGAPQLNQRFARFVRRESVNDAAASEGPDAWLMSDVQWAGWAAARAVITAVVKTRTARFDTVAAYLESDALTLDLYKGAPGNFRPWSRQLRQPILLHTGDAVIERAPIDGFLHRINDLDTLGIDEPESACAK